MINALLVLPIGQLPYVFFLSPVRSVIAWVARHLLGIRRELVVFSASDDKTYDWVKMFCLLLIAVGATLVWTLLSRRPEPSILLKKWFRLFVRLSIGATMINYGLVKVIPLQMPEPSLLQLLSPLGNFSLSSLLWTSTGASPVYENFTGCVEVLAGVLLFLPSTATLGTLICLGAAVQVFALNMTYNINVKLFSFHLILISLFLLAPELPRLIDIFLLNRPSAPSTQMFLIKSRRGSRIAAICLAALVGYLVGMNLYGNVQGWREWGGAAPKSPLYGIWSVEQMTIDDQLRAPLLTDHDRWRRVLFQGPEDASFQRMDDSFAKYIAAIDSSTRSLQLTSKKDEHWKSVWTFQQPAREQLILDGDMDGHRIHMELQRVDPKKFRQFSRRFTWVQETGFSADSP